MERERLKGHLDLLLLSVLAAGPAHGYVIITALCERSEGAFDLGEGTVYPALHRLEAAGRAGAVAAVRRGDAGSCGVDGMTGPVEEYLHHLRASLRTRPEETSRI